MSISPELADVFFNGRKPADKNGGNFSTVRLDLNTKVGLMAALILACGPEGTTVDEAIDKAIKIHLRTDEAVKTLKNKVQ